MKTINGAQGEGGGQIFRTSLTLAMCLGIAVKIENIRAGRKKPGLLRQHLTCLRAAQEISNAEVSGDFIGSSEVTFHPGKIKPGKYRFAVGSAGSTTLVFQTVYLPLLLADAESKLYLEGGTHNGMAPSFEFIEQCFLPTIANIGFSVSCMIERYGFYPAGGGAWTAKISPARDFKTFELLRKGEFTQKTATAISANIPEHVNDRELKRLSRKGSFTSSECLSKRVSSPGPGNILSVKLTHENIAEVIDIQGEVGIRAERVADRMCKAIDNYLQSEAPVGEHLADQLVLPLALAKGGVFNTCQPSDHLMTNVEVVKQLTGIPIEVSANNNNVWQVRVSAHGR